MVEKAGADLVLEHIYPPNPATTRGYPTVISINPDKTVLAYSVSNTLVLRNLQNPALCDVFTENKNNVTACKYSPSGKLIATGDANGIVTIFENIPQKPVKKTYEGVLNGVVRDIAFTGDNQRIAVVGEGKQNFAKVFLVDSGSGVGDLTLMSKNALTCDLKAERPYKLALAGEEMILYYYEGPPFKFKVSNKNHKNYINCVRFNPSGSKLVSVSSDKTILILNGLTGEEVLAISNEAEGHSGAINHVSWLDDNTFVTCSNDKTVAIWDAEAGKISKKFKVNDNPQVEDMQVSVTAAGSDIVSVSLSGALNIWRKVANLETGAMPTERIVGHQGTISYLYVHPATNRLISADNNGRIIVWVDKVGLLPAGKQHTLSVEKIVQSADPKFVFTFGKDGFIRRLDVANNALDMETPKITRNAIDLAASRTNPNVFHVLFEDKEIVTYENFAEKSSIKLAFEPSAFDVTLNDDIFVVGDVDGLVHLVEAAGKESAVLKAYIAKITVVKLNKDDSRLVCGDSGFKIKYWNFTSREELTDRWVYHSGKITSLAFSASEDYIVSAGIDNRICVWNTKTLEKEAEIENTHKRGIYACTFDEKGNFVTGGGDSLIKVQSIKNRPFL